MTVSEQAPQEWAMTQNNLGNALRLQGERAEGAEGARLLGEAVPACREALKVYTREQSPQQWATIQNNLGNALSSQGERAEGAEGVRLLGEAVAAYREAGGKPSLGIDVELYGTGQMFREMQAAPSFG